MGNSRDSGGHEATFIQILNSTARLPWVGVNRATFLRSALRHHCTPTQIDAAVATTPARAGVALSSVSDAARTVIRNESAEVTGLSAVAGLPGGLAMVATTPADLAQFLGHQLRTAQKLAYLYSWPELFSATADGEKLDENTRILLTLFTGVMFDVRTADEAVVEISRTLAADPDNPDPTGADLAPVVREVEHHLGLSMGKKLVAGGAAKVVPVVGAVLSGGLSLGLFLPMAKRLRKLLAGLELAAPGAR